MKSKSVLSILVLVSILFMTTISSVSVSAEFKYNKDGICKFYDQGNYVTQWKLIDRNWYYFNQNGILQNEKWIKSNNKWYYVDHYGIMPKDMIIDGYYVNKSGEWTGSNENIIKSSEAKNLIYVNDGGFLNKQLKSKFVTLVGPEDFTYDEIYELWDLKGALRENYYRFAVMNTSEDGKEYYFDECSYLVGKSTGNVYMIPHQGCLPMYQINKNKVIKKFNWFEVSDYYDYDWRSDLL
ncbi:hypothetical protein [Clostridium sp. BJN0001]|uniref:hypothetical protein n=1 Tax=Clostridium sp. BJN0001 TaxID=2930219 RepID=UPI001FD0880B|nr:hypothetical protein [Clostridium sp. BJN0001]